MANTLKQIQYKFFDILPLIFLFFIALSGNSIIDTGIFSVNIHYILIYFFVLRRPENLGYGYIFLSGIISDVVLPDGDGLELVTKLKEKNETQEFIIIVKEKI